MPTSLSRTNTPGRSPLTGALPLPTRRPGQWRRRRLTRDLYKMLRAWDTLEVGGVVIGDVPSWRVDHMPYGGVKDSGLGREGIRFAMENMTEIRNLVIRTL